MTTQPDPGLQSEIDSRCLCFAMPASECNCEPTDPYTSIQQAVNQAHYWLTHAYQLMEEKGINSENTDSEWPVHLADAVHYSGDALNDLDDFLSVPNHESRY